MKLGYLIAQLLHSWPKRHKSSAFRIEPAIRVLRDIGRLPYGATILSLGCRNRVEPDLLVRAGWKVTACDLFPFQRGIRSCDMHALPYNDQFFSAVLASHCLEHAYDPDRALREVMRVLSPGGLLFAAWPTGHKLTVHDRIDYKSAESFSERLPRRHSLLWRENNATESRILVRVR